ncbi:MAG: hypothetical protein ABR981_04515 [Candidatus Micrarchaeaceae archaeon]|jgi:hypothetical protein
MINLRSEIEGILSSTEDVIMCLKQSHMSSITPSFIVITDANIITVRFSFWYYYSGIRLFSSTYKNIVPYRCVTAATIRKGNMLSTLEIKTKDIKHSERKGVENSVIVDGLFTEQAEKLAKIIDLLIVAYQFPPPVKDPEKISVQKAVEICKENKKKIVWLGFEEESSVAAMLSIPDNMIERVTLSALLDMSTQELSRFQNRILLGYTTNSSNVIAKVLQLEAQLNCTVIDGGFINNIISGKTFVRRSMPIDMRHAKLNPVP